MLVGWLLRWLRALLDWALFGDPDAEARAHVNETVDTITAQRARQRQN